MAYFFRQSTQISHARRAGKPSLLNNWAMLSAGVIIDVQTYSVRLLHIATGRCSRWPQKPEVRLKFEDATPGA
jgi:hypothetical protein